MSVFEGVLFYLSTVCRMVLAQFCLLCLLVIGALGTDQIRGSWFYEQRRKSQQMEQNRT